MLGSMKREIEYLLLLLVFCLAWAVSLLGTERTAQFVAAPGYLYSVWLMFKNFRVLFFDSPLNHEPDAAFLSYLKETGVNVLMCFAFMYSFYL